MHCPCKCEIAARSVTQRGDDADRSELEGEVLAVHGLQLFTGASRDIRNK